MTVDSPQWQDELAQFAKRVKLPSPPFDDETAGPSPSTEVEVPAITTLANTRIGGSENKSMDSNQNGEADNESGAEHHEVVDLMVEAEGEPVNLEPSDQSDDEPAIEHQENANLFRIVDAFCGTPLYDELPFFKVEESGLEEKGKLAVQNHKVGPVLKVEDIKDPVRAIQIGNFYTKCARKSEVGPGFSEEVPFENLRPTLTKRVVWGKEEQTGQEMLLLPRALSYTNQRSFHKITVQNALRDRHNVAFEYDHFHIHLTEAPYKEVLTHLEEMFLMRKVAEKIALDYANRDGEHIGEWLKKIMGISSNTLFNLGNRAFPTVFVGWTGPMIPDFRSIKQWPVWRREHAGWGGYIDD